MFQLINGCIECAECRNDIRHGDEFDCYYCGASICGGCLFIHEDECGPGEHGHRNKRAS